MRGLSIEKFKSLYHFTVKFFIIGQGPSSRFNKQFTKVVNEIVVNIDNENQ